MAKKKKKQPTETLKIGAVDFRLQFENRLRSIGDGQSLWGNILYGQPRIRIDTDQDEQQRYRVLWHEIFHGIADLMSLDLKEEEIDRLASGFVQVERDNKKVLEKYYPTSW